MEFHAGRSHAREIAVVAKILLKVVFLVFFLLLERFLERWEDGVGIVRVLVLQHVDIMLNLVKMDVTVVDNESIIFYEHVDVYKFKSCVLRYFLELL